MKNDGIRRCIKCSWKLALSMELNDPENDVCNDCRASDRIIARENEQND